MAEQRNELKSLPLYRSFYCAVLSSSSKMEIHGRNQYSSTLPHDCQMKVDSSIFSSWTRSEWHIKGFLQNRDKMNTCFYCFAKLGFKRSKKQIVACSLKLSGSKSHSLAWNPGSFMSCLPISSLISCHSPCTSAIRTSSQLSHSLCLCPCCTLCLGTLLLSSCSSCCLHLKMHLTPDLSDLSSFSLCFLNCIVNRRRPGV